jgi:DNA-binding transcriptional ArsR family regulator
VAGKKDRKPGARKPKGKSGKQSRGRKLKPQPAKKELVNYVYMKGLSHELRVRIFAILCDRVASPNEMAKELEEGLSHVSYHVKVLREYHMIEIDHEVPRRGAVEHFYRAVKPTPIPLNVWAYLPSAAQSGVTAEILQEFFDDASAAMEAGIFDDPPGELSWTPLILDAEGIEEFGKLARDFLESVLALQANAPKRLPRGKAKVGKVKTATVFLATFLSAKSSKDDKASATMRR